MALRPMAAMSWSACFRQRYGCYAFEQEGHMRRLHIVLLSLAIAFGAAGTSAWAQRGGGGHGGGGGFHGGGGGGFHGGTVEEAFAAATVGRLPWWLRRLGVRLRRLGIWTGWGYGHGWGGWGWGYGLGFGLGWGPWAYWPYWGMAITEVGISLLFVLSRLLVLSELLVQPVLSLWSVQLQYFWRTAQVCLCARPGSGWSKSGDVFPKQALHRQRPAPT